MKLPIEHWLNDRGYQTNIKRLFQEAVVCFRNNAYRASLLFSYLGFLTIIKDTINKSNRPSTITEGRWAKILSDIQKDEKWEACIYEELVNSGAPIFNMNDDLRQQVKYWKDRRNDCAHFKRNEIESHHVESLWSFITSNISKMTIEGGVASMLNKFDRHFDETYTALNSNFDYLIKEITNSVLPLEKEQFFKDLKSVIDGRRWWYIDSDALKVYNRILEIGDEQTQEELVSYLKKDDRDLGFLNAYPNKIVGMGYLPSDIRALWKERIYKKAAYTNPFNLYSALLRNKLIPVAEIEESHKVLYNKFSQTDYHKLPEENDIETLKANDFFKTIIKIAVDENNLHDRASINEKCDLIALAIAHSPLTTSIVMTLIDMVGRSYYSWWLRDKVKEMLGEDEEFRKIFKRIAKEASLTIPIEFK